MEILHICNSYGYNPLYSNLTNNLSRYDINQIVFIPKRNYIKLRDFELKNDNIRLYYSRPIRFFDRLIFLKKRKKLYNDIVKNISLNDVTMSHAHNLFSDGAVALQLKREKNIKYIVAVRNTDIYVFFKYLFFYRKLGINILKEAEKIIFISPSYKEILFSNYIPKDFQEEFKNKVKVIPNGLDDFWLRNKNSVYKVRKHMSCLLYVGDFTPNKNLKSLIKSVTQLNQEGYNIFLTIIGGGGYGSNWIINLINKGSNQIIKYYGRVYDKNKLLEFYRNCDIFVMPSFHETFGLVYIEAMSQGLPVIYSKGQGIDGYFKNGLIGYAVDPHSLNNIKENIIKALNNIEIISNNTLRVVNMFSWDAISREYIEIYNSVQEKIRYS